MLRSASQIERAADRLKNDQRANLQAPVEIATEPHFGTYARRKTRGVMRRSRLLLALLSHLNKCTTTGHQAQRTRFSTEIAGAGRPDHACERSAVENGIGDALATEQTQAAELQPSYADARQNCRLFRSVTAEIVEPLGSHI